MTTTMIKYLLLILAASFIFSCAAEAQNKQQVTGDAVRRIKDHDNDALASIKTANAKHIKHT